MKHKGLILKVGFFSTVLAMLVLLLVLQVQIGSLEKEKSILEKEVEDYRLTVEEMEYLLDLPREDYIERYAREVLGYHKYSDIVIKEETDE